ncbi:sensor histidine kinase [Herbaspirillum camelliae]|uniref:sensor histidine kinase n=1 Tax=Herbaspirillum camelliae TaxID=1892903 RepID=UPI000949F6B6|nr:HAMP domain-containing sensor histidine kinase [Herbaspirillum camelliae]
MKRSLQAQLSLALTAAILVVALGAGGFGFVTAYRDSIRSQDDLLMQVGALLKHSGAALSLDGAGMAAAGDEHDSRVTVQWLPDPGDPPTDAAPLPLPADLAEGFHTLLLHHEYFRVYVQALPNGKRLALAQETDLRQHIAQRSAWRALLPFVVLAPLLLLAVQRIIKRLFAPLQALRQEIDSRREDDLQPIAERLLPREVQAFVAAINGLLARVEAGMAAQRRFVADAAHELRTPLTALSLQAERLGQAPMSETARERLTRLETGLQRARQLVTQLLALARAQTPAGAALQPCSLHEVLREVIEELLPLAQCKQIDLGVDSERDACVLTQPQELAQLLRNLIDNAIAYTPAGGAVSLRMERHAQWVALEICDTGPGIAASERERVFQPFYRIDPSGQGSGLGLAIVQSIARRLGVTLRLETADPAQQSGLRVRLLIPAA